MNREEITGNDPTQIVRDILLQENLNQRELAEKMGVTRQNVSQMFNRNTVSMRYDSFYKMIEALGYEVVVRKKRE